MWLIPATFRSSHPMNRPAAVRTKATTFSSATDLIIATNKTQISHQYFKQWWDLKLFTIVEINLSWIKINCDKIRDLLLHDTIVLTH